MDARVALAAKRLFGGVIEARAAAGVAQLKRTWTKADVIAELRAHERGGGGGLDQRLADACRRHFGSVNRARQAAGVPIVYRYWTKPMLIAELRRNWRHRRVTDFMIIGACQRVFGGVQAARRAAGLPP